MPTAEMGISQSEKQQARLYLPLALEFGMVGWEVSPMINRSSQAVPIMGIKP